MLDPPIIRTAYDLTKTSKHLILTGGFGLNLYFQSAIKVRLAQRPEDQAIVRVAVPGDLFTYVFVAIHTLRVSHFI